MIKKLTKQLFPTGKAFQFSKDSDFDKFIEAISIEETKLFDTTKNVLNSILPDNNNFTELDASQWERRLGIVSSSLTPLADRKLAIQRKMNHPGYIQARQSGDYLQQALQDAGFNVFVHWDFDLNELPAKQLRKTKFGTTVSGPYNFGYRIEPYYTGGEKLANFIDYTKDIDFPFGNTNRSFFVVSGETLGSLAIVDNVRKREFRQLILRLKPLHLPCYLFIDYQNIS